MEDRAIDQDMSDKRPQNQNFMSLSRTAEDTLIITFIAGHRERTHLYFVTPCNSECSNKI